jgi:beta-glucosidase
MTSAVLTLVNAQPQTATPFRSTPVIERRVDSLLSLMTLEEKLGQLNQRSARWNTGPGRMDADSTMRASLRRGEIGSFFNITGAGATTEVQRIAVEETRLRIPLIFGLDVIHGYRTIFPIPLAEAATFDPTLIEEASRVAAVEATAAGVHWTFAPMVDIARDPRWGRIAEGAGEDPFVGRQMAAARVRGFQGPSFNDRTSLLACAKHYAAYGGAEGGRDYNTVDVSERTLRDVYLPPFKAAVDAGAGTLMAAFNEIGGVPSSANPYLLHQVLRREWGFQGFVVSDWTSVNELVLHGAVSDRTEAGIAALRSGVDMDMESKIYADELVAAGQSGALSVAVVDEAVRRVLRVKFAKGLFEDPYRGTSVSAERAAMVTPAHRALARRVAQRSIVLLKNERGTLPLRTDLRSIAVIGPLAASTSDPLGCWAGLGDTTDVVSLLEGIKRTVGGRTKVRYERGCEVEDVSTKGFPKALAAARASEVVVLALGESRNMSGEASNRSSLDLPGVQQQLLEQVVSVGKPVVLVLMNGRPLSVTWAAEHVPAIVEGWFGGIEAGNALADVLFGAVNPSGRLPVSVPRSVGQVPCYYNHKNTGRPPSQDHYTSKYLDLPASPLYPFGFGLSYTSFRYGTVELSSPSVGWNDTLWVSVSVTNAGTRSGEEVVQLYIRDRVGSVTRPVKELKGFLRISLAQGATTTVRFALTADDLAFWNAEMHFTAEPGWFDVMVGGNSVDTQSAAFELRRR